MDSERILGFGLGAVLQELLASADRPQIRVTGFNPQEIVVAVETAGLIPQRDNVALVLVSGGPEAPLSELLEPSCFTENGRTATWGRNHNTCGLVYFQTNRESDSQSTKAMFHLRDSEFFAEGRWRHLARALADNPADGIPEGLSAALAEFVSCHQQARRLQLRPFARFLAVIGQLWRDAGYNSLTRAEGAALVVKAMPELELFRSTKLQEALAKGKTSRVLSLLKNIINSSNLQRATGGELDRDKILARIAEVDLGGSESGDVDRRRALAEAFVQGEDPELLRVVEFDDFAEALSSRTQRRQELGTEILDVLLARDEPDLATAFEKLELEDRLNDRDPSAAEEFMHEAMFHLIDADLQRDVKRLRPRRASFPDPLVGLIETLESILIPTTPATSLSISIGRGADDSPALRSLFAFLHGPLLRSLRGRLAGVVEIHLDDAFEGQPWLEHADDVEDDESDDEAVRDEMAQLSVTVNATPGDSLTFLWRPEDARVWWLWVRALCDQAFRDDPTARLLVSRIEDAEPKSLLQRVSNLNEVPAAWVYDRRRLLGECAESGVETSTVKELVSQWCLVLDDLIENAEDGKLKQLVSFVSADCAHVHHPGTDIGPHDDVTSVWMLGSHPLRLRWLVAWRDRLGAFIEGQLRNDLQLSLQNPNFFRQRIAGWSAHRYPPVIAAREGVVLLPAEERGGCECYVPLVGAVSDTTEVMDPQAIRALVDVAREYLETHPFKRDGLHILLQLGGTGDAAQEFVRQFVRQESDVRLTLHLLIPRESTGSERLADAYGMNELLHTSVHSNFPLVEIRQHPFDRVFEDLFEGEAVIDLAIVPFLFSGDVDVTLQKGDPPELSAEADPVAVRPQNPVLSRERLLIDLVPSVPDRPLQLWGEAVSIAYNRGRPGDRGAFLRLNGDIAGGIQQKLTSLLSIARQVVSLDVGISRSQMLGLQHRPQVTHVLPGVGKNGDYSLVVASNEVHAPLALSLTDLLNNRLQKMPGATPDDVQHAVRRVLEDCDRTGALLAIRGAARSAFAVEVLGRSAARRWCDRHHPARGTRVFWLALDDYDEWFDGAHADMLRVSTYLEFGSRKVELLVCESKFTIEAGAPTTARGEVQRTLNLLSDVLAPGSAGRLDRSTWLTVVTEAIQNSPVGDIVLNDGERHDLLRGNFTISKARGFGLVWDMTQDERTIAQPGTAQVEVLSLDGAELWAALIDQ